MMKRLVCFLLFTLTPIMAIADDVPFQIFFEMRTANDFAKGIANSDTSSHFKDFNTDRCTENGRYKNEYTIDRRCYITDEQKQMFPYNTVVEITNVCGHCTGVIVKDKYDGNLYVYSAGHCVYCHSIGNSNITLQDGKKFELKHMLSKLNSFGDFAVFAIPKSEQSGVPYTEIGSLTYTDVDNVGYGSLPILNDKQIHEAKKQWAEFVRKYGQEGIGKYGVAGLESKGGFTAAFAMSSIWKSEQNALKASFNCDVVEEYQHESPSTNKRACQGFHGNSGGPFFNREGKVVAIVSKGDDNSATDKYYEYPRGLEQKASSVQYALRQHNLEPYNQQMGQKMMNIAERNLRKIEFQEIKNNQRMLNKQY